MLNQNPKKVKSLDDYLNEINYSFLNSTEYKPSLFSLNFVNFIKAVNGKEGESNKTPPIHYYMLDKLATNSDLICNLLFRGAAKTTVFGEYLILYIAVFGELPRLGKIYSMIYLADSMDNGAKNLLKNVQFRYNNSEFLQHYIPKAKFTEGYMEFTNKEGKQLGVKLFGALTGLRGTKIFGKRPTLAILDDLIGDNDANSKAVMQTINDTVYKGVFNAMDPTNRRIIMNGTPFHKEDIMVKAVESGAWEVNVFPVCERFPCEPEEFRGAWEDRFSYDFIKKAYDALSATGGEAAFNQELMLRLTSPEERLVQDSEIRWYSRADLLKQRSNFNFYITTDFATSSKETADFSVISVWAYNNNGDWFWVDGYCQRATMDKSMNALFNFAATYHPQSVGIEVTGQQGGFIPWIQEAMINRNVFFNFASNSKTGSPGIRPSTDKLSRFNMVVPWFKAGKMYFPNEMKNSVIMGEFMNEIKLATVNGLKGKDDCLDTISQLQYLKPWKPSGASAFTQSNESAVWEDEEVHETTEPQISSYLV